MIRGKTECCSMLRTAKGGNICGSSEQILNTRESIKKVAAEAQSLYKSGTLHNSSDLKVYIHL